MSYQREACRPCCHCLLRLQSRRLLPESPASAWSVRSSLMFLQPQNWRIGEFSLISDWEAKVLREGSKQAPPDEKAIYLLRAKFEVHYDFAKSEVTIYMMKL